MEETQPGHGTANDQALFFLIDGVGRPALEFGSARFDFDKNERGGGEVTGHQIDFASVTGPEIPA